MPYDPKRDGRVGAGSATPAGRALLITPADAEMVEYAKALRVINTSAGVVTVRVLPIGAADGATVDLDFPVGLFIEPLGVRQVLTTGTTASGVKIWGYFQ